MSGDNRNYYRHHDPYYMFSDELSAFWSQRADGADGAAMIPIAGLQRMNDPQTMPALASFMDHVHGPAMDYGAATEGLFDVTASSQKDVFGAGGTAAVHRQGLVVDTTAITSANGGGNCLTPSTSATPLTPNSSVSSSSSEACGEEDARGSKKDQMKEDGEEVERKQQPKEGEEWSNDKSKKVNKQKKKGEKRQREPRVAFMTKSEVDHLEDGYRWRKYGQKAVKNSPHPRSYYRCTYQKCSVKKRVERSFQDPTVVITTYEGQHTHPIPATVRGNTHLLATPTTASTAASFRQDLLMHQMNSSFNSMNNSSNNNLLQGNTNPNVYLPNLPPLQQFQFPDYGLLQDMVSSFAKGSQP